MKNFNELDLEEQIKYVNTELQQGKTLTGIAKAVGIGRTTIRDRADKVGYIYNKELNKYIKAQEVYKTNEDVITKQIVNIDRKYNNVTNVKEMEIKLNEVYEWYSKQKNCIEPIELKINKNDGEAVNKTFRVYPQVMEVYKNFCEKHNVYKVQDITNQALLEFMEKYK